ETFPEPCRLDWVGSGRELFREEAELLRTQTIALPFESAQLGRLEGNFPPRGLAGDDARAGERLAHEPVIHSQGALDHVGTLGLRELRHLVDEGEFGCAQNGLHSGHTRLRSLSAHIILHYAHDVQTQMSDSGSSIGRADRVETGYRRQLDCRAQAVKKSDFRAD